MRSSKKATIQRGRVAQKKVAPISSKSPNASRFISSGLASKHCPTGVDDLISSILSTAGGGRESDVKEVKQLSASTNEVATENQNDISTKVEPFDINNNMSTEPLTSPPIRKNISDMSMKESASESDVSIERKKSIAEKRDSFGDFEEVPLFREASMHSASSTHFSSLSTSIDSGSQDTTNTGSSFKSYGHAKTTSHKLFGSFKEGSFQEEDELLDDSDDKHHDITPTTFDRLEYNDDDIDDEIKSSGIHMLEPTKKTFSMELLTYTIATDKDSFTEMNVSDDEDDGREEVEINNKWHNKFITGDQNKSNSISKHSSSSSFLEFGDDHHDLNKKTISSSNSSIKKSKIFPMSDDSVQNNTAIKPTTPFSKTKLIQPKEVVQDDKLTKLANDALGSMDMSNTSSSIARNRWMKIRNFSLALRAFSDPISKSQKQPNHYKNQNIDLNSGYQSNQSDQVVKGGREEGKGQTTSLPLMQRVPSMESLYSEHEFEDSDYVELRRQKEEETRLSLPQLLGGAQTSNEAATRWRKLRTMAKVVKAFSSKPSTPIARRRSVLTVSEKEKEDKKEFMPDENNEDEEEDDSGLTDFERKLKKAQKMKIVRRNSAPNMEKKMEITKSILSHWMDMGGKRQRNFQAAKRKAATEKHFKGLPWRCTVCEKKHFGNVELMSSSRCAACGAERDAVITPVQHWRDSVEVGDWIETKRFGKSTYYLAKVEQIKIATKDDLHAAKLAAQARAVVPSNNLRTFKGLMHAIVTMTIADTIRDIFNTHQQHQASVESRRASAISKDRRTSNQNTASARGSVSGGAGGATARGSVSSAAARSSIGGAGANRGSVGGNGGVIGRSSIGGVAVNRGSVGGVAANRGVGVLGRSSIGGGAANRGSVGGGTATNRGSVISSMTGWTDGDSSRRSSAAGSVMSATSANSDGSKATPSMSGGSGSQSVKKKKSKKSKSLVPWQEAVKREPDFDFLPSADPFGPAAMLYTVQTIQGEHIQVPRWWLRPLQAPTSTSDPVVPFSAQNSFKEPDSPLLSSDDLLRTTYVPKPKRRMSRSSSVRALGSSLTSSLSINLKGINGGDIRGPSPQSARRRRSSTTRASSFNAGLEDDNSLGSTNTTNTMGARKLKVGDHVLARSKGGNNWLKAQVHMLHKDGTISCRYSKTSIVEVGLFPRLVKLDPNAALNQPKSKLWPTPCLGCGKKDNLLVDEICVVCRKPIGHRTKKALNAFRRASQLERMHRKQPSIVEKEKSTNPVQYKAELEKQEKLKRMKEEKEMFNSQQKQSTKAVPDFGRSHSMVDRSLNKGRTLSLIFSGDSILQEGGGRLDTIDASIDMVASPTSHESVNQSGSQSRRSEPVVSPSSAAPKIRRKSKSLQEAEMERHMSLYENGSIQEEIEPSSPRDNNIAMVSDSSQPSSPTSPLPSMFNKLSINPIKRLSFTRKKSSNSDLDSSKSDGGVSSPSESTHHTNIDQNNDVTLQEEAGGNSVVSGKKISFQEALDNSASSSPTHHRASSPSSSSSSSSSSSPQSSSSSRQSLSNKNSPKVVTSSTTSKKPRVSRRVSSLASLSEN